MTTNEDGNMTRFKKVLNFAAQKERQFIQLKIISPSGASKDSILEGRYLF